jgi:hypothetical protein
MATALRRFAVVLLLCTVAAGFAVAEDSSPPAFGIKMDLGIGVQSFPDFDPITGSSTTTYQSIGLSPDISFGKFGIGLALTLNYRFTGTGNSFEIRQLDWVPATVTFQTVAALYLPKIKYLRWGVRGDPLFIKFGSFNDGTIGDGFIVGEYDNTLFLPANRHFGLQAGMDGSLFNFPFVGFETMIGDVAAFDVIGGRIYARPLLTTGIPILQNLEVGFTAAVDRDPARYSAPSTTPVVPISAFGGDIRVPIVNVKDIFTLVAFTDVAAIQGKSWGGMLGVGGKLINFLTYGAQLRVLGENFIPVYFGPTYDLFRAAQYDIIQSSIVYSSASMGWMASMGTSFLDDKIIFRVSLDGPFVPPATDTTGLLKYPHLRGILTLADGVVPGISFDFSYDKKAIATWADLVSAQNAAIKAQLNFKTGPAVISFVYTLVYDPLQTPQWNVTSGLQSTISLF